MAERQLRFYLLAQVASQGTAGADCILCWWVFVKVFWLASQYELLLACWSLRCINKPPLEDQILVPTAYHRHLLRLDIPQLAVITDFFDHVALLHVWVPFAYAAVIEDGLFYLVERGVYFSFWIDAEQASVGDASL